MEKDKQIEEMAIVLSDGGCKKCDCDANGRFDCKLLYDAELLYNAGYRKASEVTREIFEEIERETKNHGITYTQRKIAELKKKYVGKDTNVTTKTEEGK